MSAVSMWAQVRAAASLSEMRSWHHRTTSAKRRLPATMSVARSTAIRLSPGVSESTVSSLQSLAAQVLGPEHCHSREDLYNDHDAEEVQGWAPRGCQICPLKLSFRRSSPFGLKRLQRSFFYTLSAFKLFARPLVAAMTFMGAGSNPAISSRNQQGPVFETGPCWIGCGGTQPTMSAVPVSGYGLSFSLHFPTFRCRCNQVLVAEELPADFPATIMRNRSFKSIRLVAISGKRSVTVPSPNA